VVLGVKGSEPTCTLRTAAKVFGEWCKLPALLGAIANRYVAIKSPTVHVAGINCIKFYCTKCDNAKNWSWLW